MERYKIAIVGAGGLVGKEILQILSERNFPVKDIRLFAQSKSIGKTLTFQDKAVPIEQTNLEKVQGSDIAFFAGGDTASKDFAYELAKRGTVVIDNSSFFRMEQLVPLVIPEVNPYAVREHAGIIANPNCATIQLVMALKPIQVKAGLSRIIVTTYQSVSGTGREAIAELENQSMAVLQGEKVTPQIYPYQIAFNLIPQIGEFSPNGFCEEEWKIINETRKILEMPDLPVAATTVRVPVFYSHSEAVYVETKSQLSLESLNLAYLEAPGVKVMDPHLENQYLEKKYPLPLNIRGTDDVFIGRIRHDLHIRNGLHLWVVADNLRKGSALNAVQIAELLTSGVYVR